MRDLRRLNLGCGFDKKDDWVNADSFAACDPDVLMNMEETPWPFADDGFDHILLKHVLEHVGQTYPMFRAIMRELYRIAAPDGLIEIHVPHYRHETFWSDPTHVRAFTPLTFEMMSRKKNDEWIAKRMNYSMIAYDMEVDFDVEQIVQVYDPHWVAKVERGEITKDRLRQLASDTWGVARELRVRLRARKPWR